MQIRCEQCEALEHRFFRIQAARAEPVEQILLRSCLWSSKFLFLICLVGARLPQDSYLRLSCLGRHAATTNSRLAS